MSYHDVVVYVGNTKYELFKDYSLRLDCMRESGWRLWRMAFPSMGNKETVLLGGEYDGEPFCIAVKDTVICGKMPSKLPKEEAK